MAPYTQDDPTLSPEENAKKKAASGQDASASSNQDPLVIAAQNNGQTASGGSVNPVVASITANTPDSSQTKPVGSKQMGVNESTSDTGYVPPETQIAATPVAATSAAPTTQTSYVPGQGANTTPGGLDLATVPKDAAYANNEVTTLQNFLRTGGANIDPAYKAQVEARIKNLQDFASSGKWNGANPSTSNTPTTNTPTQINGLTIAYPGDPSKIIGSKDPAVFMPYLKADFKAAYGRDMTPSDEAYWSGKVISTDGYNQYWSERAQGKGAGTADAASYGAWAGGDPNAEGASGTGGTNTSGVTQGQLSAWGQNAPTITIPGVGDIPVSLIDQLSNAYKGASVTAQAPLTATQIAATPGITPAQAQQLAAMTPAQIAAIPQVQAAKAQAQGPLTAAQIAATAAITPAQMQAQGGLTAAQIAAPTSTWAPGTVAAAQAQAAQVNAPTYQQYQFTNQNIAPKTINPATVGAYSAGNVNQFTQANTAPVNDLVQQLLAKLSNTSAPDTAALKESQKETLNALQQQQLSQVGQTAALRGVAGGAPAAQEMGIRDQFTGNLTKSYRDIDQQAQQQAYNNLLSTLGAGTNVSNMLTGQAQSNYQTGLQGQMSQEQLKQVAAQSGQSQTAQQQAILSALFGQQMQNAGLNLQTQQAQAGENQFGHSQAQAAALAQAGLTQGANLANAGFQQQSNITGATLQQQAALQAQQEAAARAASQAQLQQQASIQSGEWGQQAASQNATMAQQAAIAQAQLEAARAQQQAQLQQQAAIQSGDWSQATNLANAGYQQQATLAQQQLEAQRAAQQAQLQQDAAAQSGNWTQQTNLANAGYQQQAALAQQALDAQRAQAQAQLTQQAAIQSGDWSQQANLATAQNQQQAALAAQVAEIQRQQANAQATNQSAQAQAALEAQRQSLLAQLQNSNWQFGQNLGQQGDIAFMNAMNTLLK